MSFERVGSDQIRGGGDNDQCLMAHAPCSMPIKIDLQVLTYKAKRNFSIMSEKPSKQELTILQWLAVAAVAGIVLTVILNYLR